MYLLDTAVLWALRRRDRTPAALAAWADKVSAGDLYLSAITILEIEAAARRAAQRNPAQGEALRAWIDQQVLPAFAGRILAVDTAVAQCCARLAVPEGGSERDALIAATALVHRLRLVTRDAGGFQALGVEVVDPGG